jgi:hypothetical protein
VQTANPRYASAIEFMFGPPARMPYPKRMFIMVFESVIESPRIHYCYKFNTGRVKNSVGKSDGKPYCLNAQLKTKGVSMQFFPELLSPSFTNLE